MTKPKPTEAINRRPVETPVKSNLPEGVFLKKGGVTSLTDTVSTDSNSNNPYKGLSSPRMAPPSN